MDRRKLLMVMGGGNRYGKYLIYDTFTGANGTALASHAPEKGGAWTTVSGAATIQSNKLRVDTVTFLGVQDVANANVDVTAKVTLASGSSTYIVVRYVDATHLWMGGISASINQVVLYDINGGATLRAGTAFTPTIGTEYLLRVVCSGDLLTVTVDGGNAISFESSFQNTATAIGVRCSGAALSLYDDLTADIEPT